MIETRELGKTFVSSSGKGKISVEAVCGLSLAVGQGEIFGLLGPNGSGKSTLMRMLCTLLRPTSGTARLAGHDLLTEPARVRCEIGYVSQLGGMERDVSGRENLLLHARLHGLNARDAQSRVAELLELLQLQSFADRRTSTYSGGQRRIFDLASAIVHAPRLLFLDEPSTGLDPQNRAHVWQQIKQLRERGTTIFLTTHYLEEADHLCDRVAIVDRGRMVALDSPETLKRQITGDVVALGFSSPQGASQASAALAQRAFCKEMTVKDQTLQLHIDHGEENLQTLVAILQQEDLRAQTIQLSRPTLDDVFLQLTGRSLHEPELTQ